jgi:hypothetical protein
VTQAREPREHGAEPVEQGEHFVGFGVRRQAKDLHGLQSGSRLGRFASRTPEPGQPIGPGTAGRLCNPEETRQQSPPELVG